MPEFQTTRPSRRASLRRAVRLEAEVMCDLWDTRVPLLATDLSDTGLWLQSQLPLEVGAELLVSFRPPRWSSAEPITALASVARVGLFRRRPDRAVSGMGICFTEIDEAVAAALAESLRGLPPPLPGQRQGVPPLRLAGALSPAPSNDAEAHRIDDEVQLIHAGRLHELRAEAMLMTGGGRTYARPLSPLLTNVAGTPTVLPLRHRRRLAQRRRPQLRRRHALCMQRGPALRPLLRAV